MKQGWLQQLQQYFFIRILHCLRIVLELFLQSRAQNFALKQVIANKLRNSAYLFQKYRARLVFSLLISYIKFLYIFKNLQAMSNDRLLMLAPKVGSGIELFFEILGKVYLFT